MLFSRLPLTRIKIFGAKIIYRLVVLFVGKQKRLVNKNGVTFELDLSEGIELSLYVFGSFQKHIFNNQFLKIKPNDIIFDIGANVGLMTLPFSRLVPQGKVYSFEPTNYAFHRLQKNITLNLPQSNNIITVNAFASAKSEKQPQIKAFSSWKVNGETDPQNHPIHLGTPKDTTGVPSIALDDFIIEQNITKVDFIKIDTDGHEPDVLKGSQQLIQKFKPIVLFEIGLYVMYEKNITFDFYYNYFNKLNYTLYDTKTNQMVTNSNFKKYIPTNGTTDLIAISNK